MLSRPHVHSGEMLAPPSSSVRLGLVGRRARTGATSLMGYSPAS